MMSFKDLSVCLIFKYLINTKSARYCSENLPHLPLLTFCPRLTDIMMPLKDLSDRKTGQLVVAIVVKEVKPGVIIIHDGKTSGAVLVAEDPDRKYTKGGQGLKVIKPEVLQKDPLVLRRNPLFKIVPGKGGEVKLSEKKAALLAEAAQGWDGCVDKKSKEQMLTFEQVDQMVLEDDCIIKKDISLLVCGISKPGQGQYGPSQVATVRDAMGKKTTLMVYGGSVGRMKTFDIFTITRVKRTTYQHEESSHYKLQTTKWSNVRRKYLDYSDGQNISQISYT